GGEGAEIHVGGSLRGPKIGRCRRSCIYHENTKVRKHEEEETWNRLNRGPWPAGEGRRPEPAPTRDQRDFLSGSSVPRRWDAPALSAPPDLPSFACFRTFVFSW